MSYTSVIVPTACKGSVSHQTNLGINSYDLDDLYSPDTAMWKAKVLDLASPKYEPNKTYIFDKSRYGNHGTISGATWVRLPSGLWGLDYDGVSAYTLLSNPTNLDLAAPGTLFLWVRADVEASAAFHIGDKDTANDRWTLGLGQEWTGTLTNELITLLRVDGGVATYTLGYTTATRTELYDDKHHFICVTADGSSVKLYLDGADKTLTVGAGANNGSFLDVPNVDWAGIGARRMSDALSAYHNGVISMLGILNIAWSDRQQANFFAQTKHLFGV